MKNDFTFTPNRLFEPFPFPTPTNQLDVISQELNSLRSKLMLEHQFGLTKLYNKIHDPGCIETEIIQLRGLHEKLDQEVLHAYGWIDIDTRHGHYETTQGIRFFPCHEAQKEILKRLILLNEKRFKEQ